MFIFLVASVVILFSIFGFTYSRTSFRAIQDGERLSIIRLPEFMHGTPLIQHPQAGFEGDGGIATRTSQQSLEIFIEAMEETPRSVANEQLIDQYQFERRIIDQKIRDANQLGLITESLWSNNLQQNSEKVQNQNSTETSKPPHQRINTHTIFNMIQYETFKEAMAVLKHQQEQDEAARNAETNLQQINTMENDEQNVSNDQEKKISSTNDGNAK